jgi:TolB-like protein/Tfp pilus assembly protein PilF
MLLEPGTRLGPYEVLAPLGVGGMGEVWRARDSGLGREVALKVLPAALAQDADRLARFEREAQALASLNHPNIGAIYGLERAGSSPCLVLELVLGETLEARLARGALPVKDALRVGVQIAAAIEVAHARGLVHRDLKPGNVMLTADGTVKVLDFGLARSEPSAPPPSSPDALTLTSGPAPLGATMPGVVVGTAAYMSPEQARGATVDRRADVWAFGCVLFECLAGRPAFEGATTSDLLARILEREPDWALLPAGLPSRGREILRRCLRKDASERPRDLRDVGLELAELAGGAVRADAALERSIAVLPFDNLGNTDDAFFADGMTDEILNALAHLEGLRVAARTSCFAFKGRREDLRTVGEKLDVASVLEGSVRRAGARLRITVQLVNVADGYQLWSERYDRELTDVFAVQDEIAGAIAEKLKVTFHGGVAGARPRHGTHSVEAYELFLKGRAFQYQRGRHILAAMPLFEQAIALDPNYAEAHASLADSYRLLGTFGMAPFAEVMPKARELSQRALAIDPEQSEAWATLGDVEIQFDRTAVPAMRSFDRALAADPKNVRARCERASWGYAFGVVAAEEAIAECRLAMSDDPLNAWVNGMVGLVLSYAGRHDEAIASSEHAYELDPDSFFALWNRLRAYAWAGRGAQAVALAPDTLSRTGRNPYVLGTLAWVHGQAGRRAEARAIRDEMEARARFEFMPPHWSAVAAAACGLLDEAFAYAERGASDRDPFMVHARVSPLFESMRADPRWAALAQRIW